MGGCGFVDVPKSSNITSGGGVSLDLYENLYPQKLSVVSFLGRGRDGCAVSTKHGSASGI
jgi:hypothetical protein